MKKIFTILSILCFAFNAVAETEFTFTEATDMNQTIDGITVVLAQGKGQTAPSATTDYETKKPEMRLYVGNTITISATEALTDIQIVFARTSASKNAYTDLTASVGTLVSGGESADKNDRKVDTWTGEATQVVFTLVEPGKQRQIQRILIDGEPIIIIPEEQPLPTEADLDLEYEYGEPEYVFVPDTQIFQKEYAFIDGNILVHCSKGSIVEDSEDEDAYFGCQAGETLTFTATQNIKGIAIDGNVRKNFSATCDKGNISYLSDENMEVAEDPVLIICDINAKSVTISCDKNLSCYGVEVYFEENPDPLDDEEGFEDTKAAVSTIKMLREGQLIIVRGEKEYNALGTEL